MQPLSICEFYILPVWLWGYYERFCQSLCLYTGWGVQLPLLLLTNTTSHCTSEGCQVSQPSIVFARCSQPPLCPCLGVALRGICFRTFPETDVRLTGLSFSGISSLPFSEAERGICFPHVIRNFSSPQSFTDSEQPHSHVISLSNLRCVPSGPMDLFMSSWLKHSLILSSSHVCTENEFFRKKTLSNLTLYYWIKLRLLTCILWLYR